MASAHNSSDPAPTRQAMASVQISSDPALECQTMSLEHGSLSPGRNCQENVSHGDKTGTTSNELDLLFSLMFDELLNGSTKVVSKSSAVSAADAPNPWQLCDSDLEGAFRRNACFVRNLEGVYLVKGDHSTNLYTINLHEMASASPICLMARASSTKSWLWHQRLSHLNFDTINDLAKNDLVSGLPKFKYHKEHLFPSCEQGKSKKAFHPPKPFPNSRHRLHLLHMDSFGPMRIASINRKRYVLVIVDDYSRYMWVHFLRSKDEAPKVIKTFLKRITALLQCFTENRFIIHRRFNKTPYELINGRKPDISFLYVFGAPCYPKNDHEDIGKLGAKGDIGYFIGYSDDSCAYRVYNRRTQKIIKTMNVLFDELSVMDFEQCSSKPELQSMTYGQISSRLDLTYALSTITTQQPTKGDFKEYVILQTHTRD
nr:integrase, catalytic region, zinc finger, CCHC-type, peptidase aspartic, catalytic [Tanacetum cinerariifolium]